MHQSLCPCLDSDNSAHPYQRWVRLAFFDLAGKILTLTQQRPTARNRASAGIAVHTHHCPSNSTKRAGSSHHRARGLTFAMRGSTCKRVAKLVATMFTILSKPNWVITTQCQMQQSRKACSVVSGKSNSQALFMQMNNTLFLAWRRTKYGLLQRVTYLLCVAWPEAVSAQSPRLLSE